MAPSAVTDRIGFHPKRNSDGVRRIHRGIIGNRHIAARTVKAQAVRIDKAAGGRQIGSVRDSADEGTGIAVARGVGRSGTGCLIKIPVAYQIARRVRRERTREQKQRAQHSHAPKETRAFVAGSNHVHKYTIHVLHT